jgi:uncharacterized protein
VRFFDASALVKRYIHEAGSTRVRRLLREGRVAISRLSEIEVASSIARLARAQSITSAQRDRALRALVTDLAAWTIVEVSPDVAARARRLLVTYTLRAGDAIQLAAALVLQEGVGRPLQEFVVYDDRLGAAARGEHFTVAPLRND